MEDGGGAGGGTASAVTSHSFTISIDRQFAERSNDSMVALHGWLRSASTGRRIFMGRLCGKILEHPPSLAAPRPTDNTKAGSASPLLQPGGGRRPRPPLGGAHAPPSMHSPCTCNMDAHAGMRQEINVSVSPFRSGSAGIMLLRSPCTKQALHYRAHSTDAVLDGCSLPNTSCKKKCP